MSVTFINGFHFNLADTYSFWILRNLLCSRYYSKAVLVNVLVYLICLARSVKKTRVIVYLRAYNRAVYSAIIYVDIHEVVTIFVR